MIEHPQTQAYKFIIQDAIIVKNIMRTVQDGDTRNVPEEAKVSLCSVFDGGQCFLNTLWFSGSILTSVVTENTDSFDFLDLYQVYIYLVPPWSERFFICLCCRYVHHYEKFEKNNWCKSMFIQKWIIWKSLLTKRLVKFHQSANYHTQHWFQEFGH